MKYRIYVNEDQLEKIKRIIPNINYQILNNIQPRSARSVEWQMMNKEKYRSNPKLTFTYPLFVLITSTSPIQL